MLDILRFCCMKQLMNQSLLLIKAKCNLVQLIENSHMIQPKLL